MIQAQLFTIQLIHYMNLLFKISCANESFGRPVSGASHRKDSEGADALPCMSCVSVSCSRGISPEFFVLQPGM